MPTARIENPATATTVEEVAQTAPRPEMEVIPIPPTTLVDDDGTTAHELESETGDALAEEDDDEVDDSDEEEAQRKRSARRRYRRHLRESTFKAIDEGDLAGFRRNLDHAKRFSDDIIHTRRPSDEATLLHAVITSPCVEPALPWIELLLEHGAETMYRSFGLYPIQALLIHRSDPWKELDLLVRHNADTNCADCDASWVGIHYAAMFPKDPMPYIKFMCDRGANINAVGSDGKTPMYCLLANGDYSAVLHWMLVVHKANLARVYQFEIKHVRSFPASILYQAARYGCVESFKYLVHSDVAMQSLKTVVSCEELNELKPAIESRISLEQRKFEGPGDRETRLQRLESMLTVLDTLRAKLEEDPESYVYRQRSEQSLVRRNRSLLGSLRRKTSRRQSQPPPFRPPMEDIESDAHSVDEKLSAELQRRPSWFKRMGNFAQRARTIKENTSSRPRLETVV